MSTKVLPFIPAAAPPRIAGVAPAPKPTRAAPATEVKQKVIKHSFTITNDSKNPNAVYPFILSCSCGYRFPTYTIEAVAQAKSVHLLNT
jgi:hypothetical protein